jgi:PAS domain-containing protein
MSRLQIIISTVSVIIAIPSFIWLWLNHKKRVDKYSATANALKQVISKLSESKIKNSKTEEKLGFFRELFNSANDMILVFGVTDNGKPTNLLAVNDALCKKLEYTREQLLNMTLLEIETVNEPVISRAHSDIELLTLSNEEILAQDSKYASHNMQQLLKRIHNDEEVVHKSHFVTQSQRSIPVLITAHKFGKYQDNTIVCSVYDLSEREKNESDLRSSRQKFKDLFSMASTGIATYDELKSLTNANHACLRIFGSRELRNLKKLIYSTAIFCLIQQKRI